MLRSKQEKFIRNLGITGGSEQPPFVSGSVTGVETGFPSSVQYKKSFPKDACMCSAAAVIKHGSERDQYKMLAPPTRDTLARSLPLSCPAGRKRKTLNSRLCKLPAMKPQSAEPFGQPRCPSCGSWPTPPSALSPSIQSIGGVEARAKRAGVIHARLPLRIMALGCTAGWSVMI